MMSELSEDLYVRKNWHNTKTIYYTPDASNAIVSPQLFTHHTRI